MAVGAFIIFVGLVSCDPSRTIDIYFENTSSDKCTIYTIKDSNLDYKYLLNKDTISNKDDSIIINQGDRVLFLSNFTDGFASKEAAKSDVRFEMAWKSPGGIKLEFENGNSYIYYPDSTSSQTHSPYDENSYSYEIINKHYAKAIYFISENK